MPTIGLLGSLVLAAVAAGDAPEAVGQRPYEMVWARRDKDDHPPLVDFEDLAGWHVEPTDAVATFSGSREQQIWDKYVGKLTYRADGPHPRVRLRPAQPVPVSGPVDALSLWVYGNNWAWVSDPSTPQVDLTVLLTDAHGQEFPVHLDRVNWKEWHLLHRRLTQEQAGRVKAGAVVTGLEISGGRNTKDRVLYFDNLAAFTETLGPLTFEPRPKRPVMPFQGQSPGTNAGPGFLPFPNRPQTILPDNAVEKFTTSVKTQGDAFLFTYAGPDGTLEYRIEPKTGTWADITAEWTDTAGKPRGRPFRPCSGGGVWLATPGGPTAPTRSRPLGTRLGGDAVVSRWELGTADVKAEVTYTYRLWNKSLVIDAVSPGGHVAEVRFGQAVGLIDPRVVTNPFYPLAEGHPAVAVSGPVDAPLFAAGNADWYLSNGSILWAHPGIGGSMATYNGGTRYVPKTDGTRNDVFERFFLTVTPKYEETLPTVANPVSPWKQVTGTHLWRAHGASDRARDAAFWTNIHRWGMTEVVITDHETGWRDEGESFTFRTRTAPGKGGDQGQFDYARLMQDKLGFVYGPYNNYTDFAPVNEFWSTDMVSRTSDNQLQRAWARCYAPKPARAVEYCARLAPEIQKKFHFSTAYCDVHTAVAPWDRVDYDTRVPGAGTFGAVFYSFGEIMLLQKKAWNGPVYSEGNNHAFYCGLTDGNYGQDQRYRPAVNPWLVDFDLRKLHDLCCNFGMGSPDMFYAGRYPAQDTQESREATVDRFLAATVAFGHPGFLVVEGGMKHTLRSYYMLQQLHSRYCLAKAAEICYADADGRLLDTTAAVASGVYKRSQVVTRYSDGTVTVANGHPTERLTTNAFGRSIDLPPNGYAGWTAAGDIDVKCSDRAGHRFDEAVTPAYLYVDGRGRFARGAKAAGNGIGICRLLRDGQREVLLHDGAECGFAISAAQVVALDKDGKEIGPAKWKRARGLTYVGPVVGAFSYRMTMAAPGDGNGSADLKCERDEVVPGERVEVRGQAAHDVTIPADAKPGQRIWIEREGRLIDFTVVPLAEVKPALSGNTLMLELTSHAPRAGSFQVQLADSRRTLPLTPGQAGTVTFDLGTPTKESAETVSIDLRADTLAHRHDIKLRSVREVVPVTALVEPFHPGFRTRTGKEQAEPGNSGAIVIRRPVSCGGVTHESLFMHPPYVGGVGESLARFEPVAIPAGIPVAFRALVGKEDGSDPGDGILFRVAVREPEGQRTVVAETTVKSHAWIPFEADLTRWAGRTVTLELVTDAGKNDDSTGDWGCWASTRVESLAPVLHRRMEAPTLVNP
jgi:hypothetical protein